ncbi:hypothetical protein [Pseudodesulfovibrio piezophilus]|uniref:Uncharacterized protein n=1 Tax=Pseudodesulfovibrio piezophilus (strain DSM 21447 / JCM 15486 / C1TLV30) TaxID=1322246 RepID=M1WSJ2_PSEP2|nr:hypothetical protein [Pseudodesulfovibrio piezophilus]CCH50229.1 conserved protein of unknown function [Pseudodesulfovibrio piezophilus C1TLV30]
MAHSTSTKQSHKGVIRGVIVPEQWDDHFKVTGVHVACPGEREVRIVNLTSFPALKSLAQSEAIFTGIIKKSGLLETIQLESFTLLEKGED